MPYVAFSFSGKVCMYGYMNRILKMFLEPFILKADKTNEEYFAPDGSMKWGLGIVHFIWSRQKVYTKNSGALLKYDLLSGIVTDCTGNKYMEGGPIEEDHVVPNIYFQYFC